VCTDANGVPVGIVSAGANRHDSPLLEPTIHATKQQVGALPNNPVMHLDSGYDGKPSRDVLAEHDLAGEIAKKGIPSPIQVGKRWVVERTQCAARRPVVSPVQPGGTWREVPGLGG
jgi:hypothetical protein